MQAIFLELVKLSLIGSLFAAAVMLVRLILPKTPKWIFCLLWGVVALRLICPVSIESSLSLVPDRIASGQIITSAADEYIGDVNIIYESNAEYSNAVEAGREPIYSDDGYYVITEMDSLEAPKTVGETLYPILCWIWAAGMVLMLIYTVVSYLMLRRKMAEATRLRDNIWQCEQVDSPFVLGFFKPKIYLPYTITESDMANVIAHEQAHIRRKDHWWKPIGFILLSAHWFNPVLWVAYTMLCRDIEAACDEKVIKHMEKDEMRAYSTALLNCSVNRRRIAACPLAFGEVGVKERVKTVMNYKKPAFWIVIAAVALCAVVAVCFLTNPVNQNNQIDDVSLMQFPGLKWGMTPEEVKAALYLSEDQIAYEYSYAEQDYGVWLGVTNLEYFGGDIPEARFQFCSYGGAEPALYRIELYYTVETDMAAIRDNLIEQYGPGTNMGYTDYSFVDNTVKSVVRNNRTGIGKYGETIEPNATSPINHHDVVHCWPSSVKGSDILTPEAVEEFIATMGDSEGVYASREDVLKWIDNHVWVVLRCANNSDRDDYINRSVVFNAEYVVINQRYGLTAATKPTEMENQAEDSTNATDPTEDVVSVQPPEFADLATLCFPGLNWGMTPEEVKTALNIADEQILLDEQYEYSPDTKHYDERWNLYVKDLTIFDSKVALAFFEFISITGDETPAYEYIGNTGGEFALAHVQVFLDEETDMAKLEQRLTAEYGQGVGSEYSYIDSLTTGRPLDASTSANEFLRYLAKASGEDNVYKAAMDDPGYMEQLWVCTDANVVSGGIRDYFTGVISGNGYKEEEIQEWLNQLPWITLRFTNTTHWGISKEAGELEGPLAEYIGQNYMEYMTSDYVAIAQRAALNAAE